MALVSSTFELNIGSITPDFTLPDVLSGTSKSLTEVSGEKGTLIVFACNHCPYVVHLSGELGELAKEIELKGISTVAISANDVENYPQDSPEKMKEFAAENNWNFPYLYDESQEIAKAYSASCTPDFFLLDAEGKLYYAGQFDDSRPKKNLNVTGDDLKNAVDQLLSVKAYSADMKPATGCNIKWKPGNAPAYFG